MDLNIVEKSAGNSFRVRRIPTMELLRVAFDAETQKRHKMVLTEMCNRFLTPLMNLVLAALCAAILLRSSLLRRRASFAPAVAVASMAAVMGIYMSLSNMIGSLTGFGLLTIGIGVFFVAILMVLAKK
jgi:hypothetical protein